jgi:hypothetical protein
VIGVLPPLPASITTIAIIAAKATPPAASAHLGKAGRSSLPCAVSTSPVVFTALTVKLHIFGERAGKILLNLTVRVTVTVAPASTVTVSLSKL